MLSAAKPWAYWMALPILVSTVLALVVFAAVYLKRVVEPNVRRLDMLAAGQARASLPTGRPRP